MSGWPGLENKIIECCEGNPGALNVLIEMYQLGPHPLDAALRFFETHKMQGQWIWIAYKDVCKSDVRTLSSYICNQPSVLKEMVEGTPDWKYHHRATVEG